MFIPRSFVWCYGAMVAAEPQSSTMVPPFPRDPDWGKEGRNMETIIGIVLALLQGFGLATDGVNIFLSNTEPNTWPDASREKKEN